MKELIFIELNRTALKAMHIAYELGFDINFFTSNLDLYSSHLNLSLPSFVDNIHIVNTNDINDILSYINESNVAGVFHFTEKNIITASQVAEHLELAHPHIDGIQNALDKSQSRKFFLNKSIKQPKFQIYKSQDFPLKCPMEYPCMIKPVHAIKNANAKICYNNDEFQNAISLLSIKQNVIKGNIYNENWLIEEYIDGSEYFAEFLWDGKHWILLGFALKEQSFPDCSNDFEFQFPIKLPQHLDEEKIKNTLVSWIDKIGLDWGVAQIVFKIIENEPILISIHPSLGNEKLIELMETTLQFDLVRYLVKAAANIQNSDISHVKSQFVNITEHIPATHSVTN